MSPKRHVAQIQTKIAAGDRGGFQLFGDGVKLQHGLVEKQAHFLGYPLGEQLVGLARPLQQLFFLKMAGDKKRKAENQRRYQDRRGEYPPERVESEPRLFHNQFKEFCP